MNNRVKLTGVLLTGLCATLLLALVGCGKITERATEMVAEKVSERVSEKVSEMADQVEVEEGGVMPEQTGDPAPGDDLEGERIEPGEETASIPEPGDTGWFDGIDTGEFSLGDIAIGETIPEGFPERFCPIYKPSDILMGMRVQDGDTTIFTVILGVDDQKDDIIAFYEAANAYTETAPGFLGPNIFLDSADGKSWAAVTFIPMESPQGHKHTVQIMVEIEK